MKGQHALLAPSRLVPWVLGPWAGVGLNWRRGQKVSGSPSQLERRA